MIPVPGKFRQFVERLQGTSVEYTPESVLPLVAEINALGPALQEATEEELAQQAGALRKACEGGGQALEDNLVEAFALGREFAARRVGMRPFDVQLIAGFVLHQGKIAEMQTGEGKTLAAVLPACLHALTGLGVHILTFNDYLARRDAKWMEPIYAAFGLTVDFVQEGMPTDRRKQAWAADITYATAKEAGFDFLRDQMVYEPQELVHRPFHVAIVDEADSILIDEARVPLVIAGDTGPPPSQALKYATIVAQLEPQHHLELDEYMRNVQLTEAGQQYVEDVLGCGTLQNAENQAHLAGINVALHAQHLLRKDIDYIIREGKIELVDEFTGRVVEDRQWPDGLQTALEAKEGLDFRPAGDILGSITLQHLMRLYPRLAGMTGTARPAEDEFKTFYELDVVVIPTNQPSIREDLPDLLFTHREAKHKALVQELAQRHAQGRPCLVGTCSVEESEQLSEALHAQDIPHEVLNARTDEREANIVAKAGEPGSLTISTNMAGRGTDLKLGGAQEEQRARVIDNGGLYVIGTNRHESVRIDYQLRGRAGRQGDPGQTRFFVSLEDDLMTRYKLKELLPSPLWPTRQDGPIEHPIIRREIERVQRIVEGQNLEIRKTLFKYSSFVEAQRRILAEQRALLLDPDHAATLLQTQTPAHYKELLDALGQEELHRLARFVSLVHLDRCWAEHLAHLASLREWIHLVSLGGQVPLSEFQRKAADAFEILWESLDTRILETFAKAQCKDGSLEFSDEELKAPSSTWTYLITDEPFEQGLAALFKNMNRGTSAFGFFLLIPIAIGWKLWQALFPPPKTPPALPK